MKGYRRNSSNTTSFPWCLSTWSSSMKGYRRNSSNDHYGTVITAEAFPQ